MNLTTEEIELLLIVVQDEVNRRTMSARGTDEKTIGLLQDIEERLERAVEKYSA